MIVTKDVDLGHVNANAARGLEAVDLPVEMRGRMHQFAGHDTVLENLARAVDIGQEGFESQHPLTDPGLQPPPLFRRQHPRHEVQRERALLARQCKGDPTIAVRPAQPVCPRCRVRGGLGFQRVVHSPVRISDPIEPAS